MTLKERLFVSITFVTAALASLAQQRSADQEKLIAVYGDESHCLTSPDIRGDSDNRISCFCRDAIVDARYVYFKYLLSGKDDNLNGPYIRLIGAISNTCGKGIDSFDVAQRKDWKWDGPEVVRSYPPDGVINRIRPEEKSGKPVGRWVPFTVQLVYRDAQGRVTKTENYSSREFEPVK
jgi:hypothetical protein